MAADRQPDDREQRHMGTPIPMTVVDGFGLWFPPIQTVFELTHWREDRGDISALVSAFRKDGDDDQRLIHRSRLVLYGPRSRSDYVSLMGKRTARWPFTTDWLFVLEVVVAEAMRWYEVGEPLEDLFAIEPADSVPYLFEPLVLDGEFSLMFGDGGTMKSYLGLAMCLSVATGVGVPGVGTPGRTGAALYLDYETNAQTHARRLAWIRAGLGTPRVEGRLLYRQMKRPLHEDAHQIRRLVADHNVVLVIIDSVGIACGGDINGAADTLRTVAAINGLGPAAKFGIGHKNKAADFIGSVYWRNGPRAMWEVNVEQGRRGTKRLGYIQRKTNEDDTREPLALSAEFDPRGRLMFEALDARQVDVVGDRLTDIERVARFIESARTASVRDIMDGLDMTDATVRMNTARLVKSGRIERAIRGRPGPGQEQHYAPSGCTDGSEQAPF